MSTVIDLDINKSEYEESVIALGNFDGFHIGHRNIVSKAQEIAKEKGVKSSVLLFKQHTNEVFPHFPQYYISSLDDKIDILKEIGVDYIFTIDFTLKFAQLNNEEFMLDFIRDRLNANTVVCGPDYTFGKKSKGNVDTILSYKKEGKIDAYILDNILYKYNKLSSTQVRAYIENGEVDKVKDLLLYNYKIKGKVIHGYKIGKELGFPTANIELIFKYIVPSEGVYLTNTYLNGEKYLSITSIGTNPTVTDQKEIKIEVYIIDFDKKIYDQIITIEFIKRMRDQIKFDTKEELIDQMNLDLEEALKYKNI